MRVRRITCLSRAGGGEAAGQMSGGVVEVSDEVFAAAERGDGAVILAWLTGRCRGEMLRTKQHARCEASATSASNIAQEKGLLIPPSHLRDRQMGMHVVNESCVASARETRLGSSSSCETESGVATSSTAPLLRFVRNWLTTQLARVPTFFGVW